MNNYTRLIDEGEIEATKRLKRSRFILTSKEETLRKKIKIQKMGK